MGKKSPRIKNRRSFKDKLNLCPLVCMIKLTGDRITNAQGYKNTKLHCYTFIYFYAKRPTFTMFLQNSPKIKMMASNLEI